MSRNYLFELGTEELPPRALLPLSEALENSVCQQLAEKGLTFSSYQGFCSPRRLAFLIKDLDDATPTSRTQVWGPPAKIAFNQDGTLSKAGEAFCQRSGIDAGQLEVASDGKVEKLSCFVEQGAQPTSELLPDIITEALVRLPIPKRMRWGRSRQEFVRPVHWLVLLCDDELLPCSIMGLNAGRLTRGHRFLSEGELSIARADEYAARLLNHGKVIVDFAERRENIRAQVEKLAADLGGQVEIDPDLLDEVCALVEWPVAIAGNFDERFLAVPAEALILSMKEHQKYFHLRDADGNLLPRFITISNIECADYSSIIEGNEKVIRPRLADAAFFFETDKKQRLDDRLEKLKSVVFQEKLGSVYDKTRRISALVATIAGELDLDPNVVQSAERAAQLCKSDLVSAMVYEFPEMQGLAGFHYALNDGESEAVAEAIRYHYQPRFAGDTLPQTIEGRLLALADRLDTVLGIFGVGLKPSGSKDPFALRRASVGILRLIIESDYALDLKAVLTDAHGNFEQLANGRAVDDALNYIFERFPAWYEDLGVPTEAYLAVSAKALTQPLDIHQRVLAVHHFYQGEAAEALAAANKRVANILAKVASIPAQVDKALLTEQAERDLASHLDATEAELQPLLDAKQYTEALTLLSDLRAPVDQFFEEVMVMADDAALRNNRLALLNQLRNLFLEVADISLLMPAK